MEHCSAVPPNIFGRVWEQAAPVASGLGSPGADAYPDTGAAFCFRAVVALDHRKFSGGRPVSRAAPADAIPGRDPSSPADT